MTELILLIPRAKLLDKCLLFGKTLGGGYMDIAIIRKQVVDILMALIKAIKTTIEGISSLPDEHSETSKSVITVFEDVNRAMGKPGDREKIDVERLRAFSEFARSIVPFAFVEYLFYVTKVAGMVGLASVFWYWYWRRKRV